MSASTGCSFGRRLNSASKGRKTFVQCHATGGKGKVKQQDDHLQTRREFLLNSTAAAPLVLAGMLIGTDDPTTIANSILSAYGLPMLKSNDDLRYYDEFENEWVFAYPKSWVARPNTMRSGFYVSNFQTADKATVEAFTLPAGWSQGGPEYEAELVKKAVTAAVVPGQSAGQQDDKLTMPADRLIKTESKVIDGQNYIYIAFPSETLTRSGYAIKRKHFAVVAAKKGVGYTLSASARSDQYNKDKEKLLRSIVDSFRLR